MTAAQRMMVLEPAVRQMIQIDPSSWPLDGFSAFLSRKFRGAEEQTGQDNEALAVVAALCLSNLNSTGILDSFNLYQTVLNSLPMPSQHFSEEQLASVRSDLSAFVKLVEQQKAALLQSLKTEAVRSKRAVKFYELTCFAEDPRVGSASQDSPIHLKKDLVKQVLMEMQSKTSDSKGSMAVILAVVERRDAEILKQLNFEDHVQLPRLSPAFQVHFLSKKM